MHPGDLLGAQAALLERSDVRRGVPGAAHDADPAGRRLEHRGQHLAQLGPVVVGDDDIGVLVDAGLGGGPYAPHPLQVPGRVEDHAHEADVRRQVHQLHRDR